MLADFWSQLVFDFKAALSGAMVSLDSVANTLSVHISLVSLLDLALVFGLLWWLYRRLRRTDLLKILPRLFLLLLILLIARIFGLWALYYLSGFLLFAAVIAIGAMYAPEIKHILEISKVSGHDNTHKSVRVSTGDTRSAIKTIVEAIAVLTRSNKPALIIIRTDKAVTRLIDNGTKLNTKLSLEFLIELFSTNSELSRGALVIDGDRIVAAGSTLLKPKTKVLFNPNNPDIKKAVSDLNVIAIVLNKTFGDISVIANSATYKNLTPGDIDQILTKLLITSKV